MVMLRYTNENKTKDFLPHLKLIVDKMNKMKIFTHLEFIASRADTNTEDNVKTKLGFDAVLLRRSRFKVRRREAPRCFRKDVILDLT